MSSYFTNLDRWHGIDKTIDFLPAPHILTPATATHSAIADSNRLFVERVDGLSADEYVLEEERIKPPRNQNDFGLTPLYAPVVDFKGSQIINGLRANKDVIFEYTDYNPGLEMYSYPGMPYVDGHMGVGLTFQRRLVAICMGVASTEGPIITQLQDVSQRWDHKQSKLIEPYKNGLHSGIDWKKTLVKSWLKTVPETLCATAICSSKLAIQMQSGLNNYWLHDTVTDRTTRPLPETRDEFIASITQRLMQFNRTYDAIAISLGGIMDSQTNNYVMAHET